MWSQVVRLAAATAMMLTLITSALAQQAPEGQQRRVAQGREPGQHPMATSLVDHRPSEGRLADPGCSGHHHDPALVEQFARLRKLEIPTQEHGR